MGEGACGLSMMTQVQFPEPTQRQERSNSIKFSSNLHIYPFSSHTHTFLLTSFSDAIIDMNALSGKMKIQKVMITCDRVLKKKH